jgi:hypothetical protein
MVLPDDGAHDPETCRRNTKKYVNINILRLVGTIIRRLINCISLIFHTLSQDSLITNLHPSFSSPVPSWLMVDLLLQILRHCEEAKMFLRVVICHIFMTRERYGIFILNPFLQVNRAELFKPTVQRRYQ